jgi:hypothetical protein
MDGNLKNINERAEEKGGTLKLFLHLINQQTIELCVGRKFPFRHSELQHYMELSNQLHALLPRYTGPSRVVVNAVKKI